MDRQPHRRGVRACRADCDNRWRTGGSVDEVIDEAHLSPKHIVAGIERFVRDREKRLRRLATALEAASAR